MGSDNCVVIILANKDFRDEEYTDTFEALRSAGVGVKIAAASNEDCIGIGGTTVSVDYTLDEVDPAQFNGIVLIGGVGIQGYLHDEALHSLIQSFVKENKLIAAICWAPAILANAGVIEGIRATAWSGASQDLVKGGAVYTAEAVTVDGKFITADGPDSAAAFGSQLSEMIIG